MITTEAADATLLYERLASRPEFEGAYCQEKTPGRVKELPLRCRTDFLRRVVDSAHHAILEAS
jgi:hypothetical protein